MKDDTETAVNRDSKRPHEYGVLSIEDQHKRDVESDAQEREAVNASICGLTVWIQQRLNEQQIAVAGRDDEHQANSDTSEVIVHQLYTASDTKHGHLYDYDDGESCD